MGHLSGVCAGLITVGGLTERLMPSKGAHPLTVLRCMGITRILFDESVTSYFQLHHFHISGFSAYLEDRVFPFSLLGKLTNYVRCPENQNQMSAMLSAEGASLCTLLHHIMLHQIT